ncbi:MAG: hypothetical protein NTY74_10925 [Ignavibacteriae bacterium]|nr:hypothetical protein [Ignavibacteriota bacterium]
MNKTKIRNKKEIGDSILRGLKEALEFVTGEKDNSSSKESGGPSGIKNEKKREKIFSRESHPPNKTADLRRKPLKIVKN